MTTPASPPASSGAAAHPDAASFLHTLETRLAAVQSLIHELELVAVDRGVPVAPLYLASARGSLRYVSACIGRYVSCSPDAVRDEIVLGSGILLRASDHRAGVGTRARADAGGLADHASAELQRRSARPDLGAHLLRSVEASALCGGPVGATLMFAALAHQRWLHLPTRTKWSTDVSGARALVAALTDGAGFDMPTAGAPTRLVDALVVDLLGALGWTRLLTPAMPGGAAA